MYQHTLWLIIMSCSLITFSATTQNVDSLKSEIKKCSSDFCRAKLTYNISKIYLRNNRDSALHYELLNRAASERTNLPDLLIKNLFMQVALQSQQKNFNACDSLYSLMYAQIKEHGVEEKYLPNFFASRGVYYQRRNLLDSAIAVYQIALGEVDTSFNDYYEFQHVILGNLGKIERKRGNFKKALSYYEKAQENLERDSLSFKNKFTVFEPIGYLYKQLGDFESSLYYYKKAAANAGILADNRASIIRDIGEIYALQKDTINTLAYVDSLLEIFDEVTQFNQCKLAYSLNEMYGFLSEVGKMEKYVQIVEQCYKDEKTKEVNYLSAKAKYYYIREEYKAAYKYYNLLYHKSLKSERNKPKSIASILDNMIRAGIRYGANLDELVHYYNDYETLQDSIRTLIVDEEIEKYNVRYQTRLKQDSIHILELQTQKQATSIRNKNIGIVASILLLLLSGGIIYLYRKNVKQEKAINTLLQKEKAELIFEKRELKTLNATLQEKVAVLKKGRSKKLPTNKLELKSVNKIHLIDISTIRYIKAEDEGCRLYLGEESIWVESSLKNLLEKLPADLFVRIYRSTVVHVSFIAWVNHASLQMQDGTDLRIGRTYKGEILRRFKV